MSKSPSRAKAIELLEEASMKNPGLWVQHSYRVAEGAELIAKNIDGLDSELAYVLGLLHDIGRREGVYGMRHSIDGFNFAMNKGYEHVAQICLTHVSFRHNDEPVIVGKWDGSTKEKEFVINYLSETAESDYDRLIKLCDCVSLPNGFCLIEKRLVDTATRGGVNNLTIPRWNSTFEIKKHFEDRLGKSIYDILPNVVETTVK